MAIQDTSIKVSLQDVAQLIENDLNTISSQLYSISEIDTEVVFNITADSQEYNNMTTTTNTAGDDVYYTPGILEAITISINQNPNMSIYNEAYSLQLYGYYDEMEDVRIIYDKYIMSKKGEYITYNNWLVKKEINGIDFAAPIDPDDGTGKDRYLSISTFVFKYIDGGIHSTNTTLSIDSVNIPFYTFTISREKQVKGGSYSTNDTIETRPKTQSISYFMTMPFLSSKPPLINIVNDIRDDNYMKNTYEIQFDDGVIDTTYKMYLSNGTYKLDQDGIVVIDATFTVYRDGGI